jgi:hypothetical protein
MPRSPGYGVQKYRVTFFNSTTSEESDPTDTLEIAYTYSGQSFPVYRNTYRDGTYRGSDSFRTLDPEKSRDGRCFNSNTGLASPHRSDVVQQATITGFSPSGSGYDTVRLWRLTSTAWRLVKSNTISPGAGYTILDDQGGLTETNDKWRPNGSLPRARTMCSFGGRLVTAYENRITISDFVPQGQDTDPFPRFAPTAIEDSDGWAFDLGPGNYEQIQAAVSGDIVYLLTSHNCYLMSSLSPNTAPYRVFAKGALGRSAAIYVENALIWASNDGVYINSDRYYTNELSQEVRRGYVYWLRPDTNVTLGYQDRKLYIFQDYRYLRYDFVTKRWTRGTLAHKPRYTINFVNPVPQTNEQQLWFVDNNTNLARWQVSAAEDMQIGTTANSGYTVPDWIYGTGYMVNDTKQGIATAFIDTTGDVAFYSYLSSDTSKCRVVPFYAGEATRPISADFAGFKMRFLMRGQRAVNLRRLKIEREALDSTGAYNTGREI